MERYQMLCKQQEVSQFSRIWATKSIIDKHLDEEEEAEEEERVITAIISAQTSSLSGKD